VNKFAIKILQGSVVTQTVLGGLTIAYIFLFQMSCGICVPKMMKIV